MRNSTGISKEKLGLKEAGEADATNVKWEPDMVGLLTQTYEFLPGYHMNKKYWITHVTGWQCRRDKNISFFRFELRFNRWKLLKNQKA